MNWSKAELASVSAVVGIEIVCAMALVMGYATHIGAVIW